MFYLSMMTLKLCAAPTKTYEGHRKVRGGEGEPGYVLFINDDFETLCNSSYEDI
jgi:hypothetical protein